MSNITPVWNILADGAPYVVNVLGARKDVMNEMVKPDREFYKKSKITLEQVGINIVDRIIKFKDLELNTVAELKAMKLPMLQAVLCENFKNDNMTYFMLERGLVNDRRDELTPKGREIRTLWLR